MGKSGLCHNDDPFHLFVFDHAAGVYVFHRLLDVVGHDAAALAVWVFHFSMFETKIQKSGTAHGQCAAAKPGKRSFQVPGQNVTMLECLCHAH